MIMKVYKTVDISIKKFQIKSIELKTINTVCCINFFDMRKWLTKTNMDINSLDLRYETRLSI